MKSLFYILTFMTCFPIFGQDLQLAEKANQFSDALTSKKFNESITFFSTELISQLPESKLAEIWMQIEGKMGKYLKKQDVRVLNSGKSGSTVQPLEFSKEIIDLKLSFDAEEKINAIFFAPHESLELNLESTNEFTESEITVQADKKMPLQGILTAPKGKSNVPVLILVHGSGANDMDETYGKHKLFKELAHGLAAKGIAVIRYNKRTKTYGGTDLLDANTLTLYGETIEDALAAVKLASKNPIIDKNKIFVLGHSLGGMSAPRIADFSKKTKGIIILGGNARPLQDVVLDQYEYLFNENGTISKEEERMINGYKQQLKVLDQLKSEGKAVGVLPMGLSAAYWNYLLEYDQVETAKKIKQSILVIQGGRDYQVTTKEYEIWVKNLTDKKNTTFKNFEKLNHLMLEGEGPSYPSEYEKEGNVPNYLIDYIADWILAQN